MVSETADGTDFHRGPAFNDLWQSVKSVAGEEVQMETVISALDARTQFGRILKRTEENKERFFLSKRGKLKAVLISMEDYVQNIVDEPDFLKDAHWKAEEAGLNGMTMEEIDREIAEVRRSLRSMGRR